MAGEGCQEVKPLSTSTQSCTGPANSNFHTLCLQQSAWDALLGDHWPYSLSEWSSLSWRSRRGALWRRCRPSSKISSNPSNRPIPESSPVKWYSSISLLIVYYIQSICKFEFLLSKTWTLSMTPACRMRLLSSFLVSRYPKYCFFFQDIPNMTPWLYIQIFQLSCGVREILEVHTQLLAQLQVVLSKWEEVWFNI